jgi:hypothetical protein
MKLPCLASSVLLFTCLSLPQPEARASAEPGRTQRDYAELRARAEQHFAAGSYLLALRAYEAAARLELAPDERAWVEFRLADARWRQAAQSANPDTSELDRAGQDLRQALERYQRPEQRDELFAELHESLGDLAWRREQQDWGTAWSHYSAALEWWARSGEIERARARYLGIVFRAALPPWHEEYWGVGYFPSYLPIDVLENASRIAKAAEDQARAHYLLGRQWMNQGHERRGAERAQRELESVLALGKQSAFYDDALFALASFFEGSGSFERDAQGAWQARPDYPRALELHRRLLSEFRKGETRYFDAAAQRAAGITAPTLAVLVERFFLPGSEVQYTLSWRNLARVECTLHPVDLTRDLDFSRHDLSDWLAALQLERSQPSARWVHETHDTGRHESGQARLVLERKPEAGAYVLRAQGPGVDARALVLVSDAALSIKCSGTKLLAWASEVKSGAPIAQAEVRVWERWHDGRDWRRQEHTGRSGDDGVALFELEAAASSSQFFVTVKSGARQAFAQGYVPGKARPSHEWKIYACTDRSAYRPADPVSWKFWARTRFASAYRTPSGERVAWEILDPLGSVAQQGVATLNAFGAAWGTLETTAAMALGEYRVRFFLPGPGENERHHIGDATLFRLEEYKLPEYEVTVKTPEDPPGSGRPKLYLLGDRVEAEVEARYYYGAPVADATVEIFVHQRPRYRPIPLHGEREFPWYYPEEQESPYWGGGGQQILHETRRTDAAGKASVAFDTPAGQAGEFEYEIEARVTDASRREITGSGRVVVAAQGYSVQVEAAHAIHRPGAEVEVTFRAQDPNGNPVQDEGVVEVTRQRWIEVWLDPTGREVTGDALRELQMQAPFPPDQRWRVKFSGYEREPLARAELRTGRDGKATFRFTPAREGYYQIGWASADERENEIRAQGSVFVADERTTQLGYLPGGIEILVDQDTLEVGREAAILLLAPSNGRHVLFTVEGEDLYRHEVLRLDGQVKLVQLPITEVFVPNVFLGATSVWGGRAYQDMQELVVPPVQQFLSVEVATEKPEYLPGEEGTVSVDVRDRAGNPVSVELALSVLDEAVAYIQGDYAQDPRQFFYGEKRILWVQSAGTFQHGWFADLKKDERGNVRDDRAARAPEERQNGYDEFERDLGLGAKVSRAEGRYRSVSDSLAPAALAELDFRLGKPVAGPGGGATGSTPTVRVRSDFRATALWLPDVHTDATGHAAVRVKFPDSTTRWRALARATDAGTRVGQGSASARTRQPLITRLQAPRFLVVGDEVTLSGNLNNELGQPVTVQAALEVQGLELLGFVEDGALKSGAPGPSTIPANGQVRIDWRAAVREPGTATLKLAALGEESADAIEQTLPVYPHGIEAFVNLTGKLEQDELALMLELPRERRSDSTTLEVTIAPSLAVTMLDALPYLADYPYGCVEQTLSRFLPAVIVARTLRDQGLSAEDALTRVFGGTEPEFAGQTHLRGKRALERLDEMVAAGLERLYDFQHGDGGWAWWKSGDSDHFMTAYVLWGLALARESGLDVRTGVLERAAQWLVKELVERESEPDLQAWMLHALAVHGGAGAGDDARRFQQVAFDNLWHKRDALNAYSRALLALAARHMGREQDARLLVDNLRNGVVVDRSPDGSIVTGGTGAERPYVLATAHYGQDGIQRRWSEGGVEATAFALRALLAVDARDELVTPLVNWLVRNRRGAQWSNTRDTAITVLVLNDYLRASGELGAPVEYELLVNGRSIASRKLEGAELLAAPGSFLVPLEVLKDGANEIRIVRRSGASPLYFSARARFFSREEPIPARGSELFLRRDYYRLAARPTLLAGTLYERVPLGDGEALRSGERVEVVLTIEAKNELEYLVFEDLKPAGFEAVQVRSGEPLSARELKRSEAARRFGEPEDAGARDERRRGPERGAHLVAEVGEGYTGRARSAHQELRDRQVALFLDRLPQGVWELRYELRAEAPGSFHALPVLGHAMYVPEIRGNGAEQRVLVLER